MDQLAGPSERKCLICGAKTSSCHLGVDACRACTVFYRRAKTRKLNACRSNKLRCGIETGALTCKRCRFDRFERILKESGAKEMLDVSHLEEREPSPAVNASVTSWVTSKFASKGRLIEQCKLYYRLLCSMRRTCELSWRARHHPAGTIRK
ncbi:hypothetical protein PENTCL1PPCAC_15780 [Pristionchus entomophagus]|uniref:Nuclear receptor domain-containing protein n=1 Tax=Pristionchus entomophagus TaxID=358040 RepID=A0AAV5TH34_9BILA|nr:hypothetical protein PENTCL1PPCAC_15780 [Pristionchus entomophagus]